MSSMQTRIATRALVVAALVPLMAAASLAKTHKTHSEESKAKAEKVEKTEKATKAPANDPIADVEKAAGHKIELGSKVKFVTSKGTFVAVLFPKEAPKTVANFEKLVKSHFYDGLTFHRVIPGFVAQGGDPKGTGEGGPGWSIPDELSSSVKHLRGSLAMAKSSMPNSAGSQFYIGLVPLPQLDGRYTVFGQVTSGMDVVDKLQPTEGPDAGKPDKMLKVTLIK